MVMFVKTLVVRLIKKFLERPTERNTLRRVSERNERIKTF